MSASDSTTRRHFGPFTLVLFGLAYMAPLIVLGTFGIVAQASHGATASSYALALVALLFTAASYCKMAALHPVAGSAYTYVSHAMGRRTGFLIGWAVTLDYLFLPMVTWLIGAAYLHDSFPMLPMPALVLGFIAITTLLNIVGFRLAKGLNLLLMFVQAVVLVLFVKLAIDFIGYPTPTAMWAPFVNPATNISAIAAGAAVAAYSFLGFDAVTTLAEETREPKKTMPRAIWLTALAGGVIFIAASYAAQLAHPGSDFHDVSAAGNEVALKIGGQWFGVVFLAGLIVAQLASGVASQAAGARLIYAMARDGVLPRQLLGRLHPKYGTPVGAVILTGLIGLLALGLTVESSTSFINFGAFSAFAAVNLSVVATALRERRPMTAGTLIGWYLAPLAGAAIDIWLLTQLEPQAIKLGLVWLVVGIVILAWLTRGFTRPPPALHVEEA